MQREQIDSPRNISIGSASSNDLVFKQRTVSSHHARIFKDRDTAQWFLEDLNSTNGTFLNDVSIAPKKPLPLPIGSQISLGRSLSFLFDQAFIDHANTSLSQEGSTNAEQTMSLDPVSGAFQITQTATSTQTNPENETPAAFQIMQTMEQKNPVKLTAPQPITKKSPHELQTASPPADPGTPALTLGYADDNDVQIKNAAVSGYHAKLFQTAYGLLLEDQGSTNGTWFNGERIHRVKIAESDQFSLGNYTISVSDLLPYFSRSEQSPDLDTSQQGPIVHPIIIGREASCDIQINAPMISLQHIRLNPLPEGRFQLEDLGSTNGTAVNSRLNLVKKATVESDDVLFLGSYRLPLSRLNNMLSEGHGTLGIELPKDKKTLVVGRDKGLCDIVLNSPQVSRKHAELVRLDDGQFELRDLGSINGTYVNRQRIKARIIQKEDLISFANYEVQLDLEKGLVKKDQQGDITVRAEGISVNVKDRQTGKSKTILKDIDFTALPTEFVGLMGPSGSGKTTLMMALNGYMPPSAGRSIINGDNLYTKYDSFRGNIGYVPQDDIIFPQLTVYESLYFTAKLRLPPDTSDEEIEQKITQILNVLEIQQTREIIIGDALKKGISGGQRKRVNLAMELLTEPSLLFLDEPTSGLASEDTINVMNLLRRLADEGRTILLTIHQPSLEAYRKLDNVIYLFHGQLVYYGPAHPDSFTYFYPDLRVGSPEGDLLISDPGNVLKVLANEHRKAMDEAEPWEALESTVENRKRTYCQSEQYKAFVYDRAEQTKNPLHPEIKSATKPLRADILRQWWVLSRRLARIKQQDLVNTIILLLQAPIIAVVLWLVFAGQMSNYFDQVNRGPSALFLLVASAVWFGCSNSAREIVGEQAIYKRERMVNLMIPSYVGSKVAVLGVVCAIQCALLLCIIYPALGFEGAIIPLYFLLLLSSMAGVGMGLTLSAIVKSNEAAIALVPLLLIPQIILGGIIMPVQQFNAPMKLLSATMVTRWGYEGALNIEFSDDTLERIQEECGITVCPDPLAFEDENDETGGTSVSAYGGNRDASYFPTGEGSGEDICNVLCTNARRGIEVSPLERSFGINLDGTDAMRQSYLSNYGVGQHGTQTGLSVVWNVLICFNLLLFCFVCAILRLRDGDIG
jgi:ABC-type multidrug transport system ATPase subunit